jgi:FkbM family methyltransferase
MRALPSLLLVTLLHSSFCTLFVGGKNWYESRDRDNSVYSCPGLLNEKHDEQTLVLWHNDKRVNFTFTLEQVREEGGLEALVQAFAARHGLPKTANLDPVRAKLRDRRSKRTIVFADGPVAIKQQWRHGKHFMYHRYSVNIAPAVERFGEWEESAVALLSGLLDFGAGSGAVYDVGANVGLFSFAMLAHGRRRVGGGGRLPIKIHAFEPQPPLCHIISGNVAIQNAWQDVVPHNTAVGAKAGLLSLPVYNYNAPERFAQMSVIGMPNMWGQRPLPAHGGTEKPTETYSVPVTTLTDLVAPERPDQVPLDCPQLIKVDVEGAEISVLEGSNGMMKLCRSTGRPYLYLEEHNYENSAVVKYVYKQLGYARCYFHFFPYYLAENFAGSTVHPSWAAETSRNVLCVPPERFELFQQRVVGVGEALTEVPRE